MRLAISYFRPSGALFRENLKRFWAVPALGMLAWFLAGIFPLLVETDAGRRQFLAMAAEMRHPAFLFFTPVFPFIASAATLRYLFSPASVAAMHTLPVTRGRLYCTSFVSVSAMSLAPAAITYAALAIAGAPEGYNMLPAFAVTLLMTLFYTTLFHVAAMLTGNSVMHLGVCGFLSFALPALVLLGGMYCRELLFGYDGSAASSALAVRLIPLFYVLDDGILRSAGWVAAYILAVPALYAAGAALYARRPLEKAGDSIVFPFFELIFTFVVAFAGMTLASLLFNSVGWGRFPLNSGLVVGAAISFLAARMVSQKSLRVFNKSTLAQGGACAAAAALFLCILSFDLTGYERRVPQPERVRSVELEQAFIASLPGRSIRGAGDSGDSLVFTEPENIRAVIGLHEAIVEELRERVFRAQYGVYLRYNTDSGEISRSYYVPSGYVMENANTRAIFESEEFKLQNDVNNAALGQPVAITLTPLGNTYIFSPSESADIRVSAGITISSDEYAGLLDALSADMRGETWEDLIAARFCDFAIHIEYQGIDARNSVVMGNADIHVPPHYARTIAWLAARGYAARLTSWREQISSARLVRRMKDSDETFRYSSGEEFEVKDMDLVRRAL
ncbi:MAG: hypothetical protein LBD49_06390, partial [Oscillospiraceae bacterium]|nr:hypothetical protein [Oscillospiraceae bacterium]